MRERAPVLLAVRLLCKPLSSERCEPPVVSASVQILLSTCARRQKIDIPTQLRDASPVVYRPFCASATLHSVLPPGSTPPALESSLPARGRVHPSPAAAPSMRRIIYPKVVRVTASTPFPSHTDRQICSDPWRAATEKLEASIQYQQVDGTVVRTGTARGARINALAGAALGV